MINIHIWKLGNHYEGTEDRNGGKAEFNFIYNHLMEACQKHKAVLSLYTLPTIAERESRTVTFIVNGIIAGNDMYKAEMARNRSDVLVYVFTDYGFAENNEDIIKMCDFVLHQSPMDRKFELFGIPGAYSYIPELFFDTSIPVSEMKIDLCFFGGNQAGREDEFGEYIIEKRDGFPAMRIKDGIAAFFKDKQGKDFRIAYKDYRRVLSLFQYAFVSGRTAGKEVGWVTPRLVEAVNAGCVPILIGDYDQMNHFGFEANRVNGYKELKYFMEEVDLEEEKSRLDRAAEQILEGQDKFADLMKEMFFEVRPLHSGKTMV